MVANKGSTILNGNIHSGHLITLNIHVPRDNINQPMQFDVQMFIGDIIRSIQGHLPITIDQDRKTKEEKKTLTKNKFLESDYGLFMNDVQHPSRSYWLDPSRTLNYYPIKAGVCSNIDFILKRI
jgi:hypothetical protein